LEKALNPFAEKDGDPTQFTIQDVINYGSFSLLDSIDDEEFEIT